jgi:uncharacterized protein YqjF (DUF2071 family)
MTGIRPRLVPPLPWISAFPELNVRTYVTLDGKPGLFFLSMEAGNPLAVALARQFFYLPYFSARMAVTTEGPRIRYSSERTHRGMPSAEFLARYGPTGDVSFARPGTLEHFLTERYCLYTVHRERVYRCEVHHPPWPLQPAEAEFERNTMLFSHGLQLPDTAPLLHFSSLMESVFWPMRRLKDTERV